MGVIHGVPRGSRFCIFKIRNFHRRARRSEFWWFTLFNFIASLILAVVDSAIIGVSVLGAIYGLATLIPGFAVSARRLHDIGRSGWWFLIILIPLIGAIVLLIWYIKEGTPDSNEYGPPV